MITDRDTEFEDAEPLPHDRADGSAELDTRTVLNLLFNDPDIRVFTFTTLGALGMIFLILFERGSDIGGLLIVILGVCGLILRWTASPVFVLFILTYFAIFPFGIPGDSFEDFSAIDEDHFRVTHVLLVMSVLVYLACQYRILGLVHQAVAFDGHIRRKDESPLRRPAALIRSAEYGIMLGVCAALVFSGQLIWWFANSVEVVPAEDFPLRWAEPGRTYYEHSFAARHDVPAPGSISTGPTRFIILVGLLFFGAIIARVVFGYWRLRMMGPTEGAMILLDGGWSETSRDRQRIEKWRIWGRNRAEAQASGTDKAKTRGKS